MSQSIPYFIASGLALSLSLWSIKSMLKSSEQNTLLTRQLWTQEYLAHSCGRLISALANLKASAEKGIKDRRYSREEAGQAIEFLEKRFFEKSKNKFTYTNDTCYLTLDGSPVAEIYLRDRFHTSANSPKYSYRILLHKL